MREAELLGIAWEDVDFAAGTVRVHQQLVRVAGEWRLAPPKTKAGARTVALAPDAMAALRDHQRRMAAERTPDWPFYGLVFVTERGKPIYGWRLLQMLGAHARRLGLPPVHVHDLRHSAATLMLEAGLTLEDVKQTLGHSTIAITSDVYSHPSKERQHEVARRMQETVGGA
jgi:integrase